MSELSPELAFSRVTREYLHDPLVVEAANNLHVRLPQGEALNNVVLVEDRTAAEQSPEAHHKVGVAVLTPGTIASKGEVVLSLDPSLNGETAHVKEELTGFIGRIARQRGFSSLRISEVQRERVDVVRDGKPTGQKMNRYRPVLLGTVQI